MQGSGVAAYCIEIGTSFFQPCTPFEKTIFPDNLPALVYAAKVAAGTMPVAAGQIVTLSAVIDDTRYKVLTGKDENEPVQNIAATECYIDASPWDGGAAMPMAAVDGVLDSPVEAMSATIDSGGLDAGRHIVFVRGQDADGNWGAVSAVFLEVVGE